jgi:hypothetical protein
LCGLDICKADFCQIFVVTDFLSLWKRCFLLNRSYERFLHDSHVGTCVFTYLYFRCVQVLTRHREMAAFAKSHNLPFAIVNLADFAYPTQSSGESMVDAASSASLSSSETGSTAISPAAVSDASATTAATITSAAPASASASPISATHSAAATAATITASNTSAASVSSIPTTRAQRQHRLIAWFRSLAGVAEREDALAAVTMRAVAEWAKCNG